mgnify:CR=1 FL=1
MKKKHVVLAAATLSLALTMGAYKSYADAATKKMRRRQQSQRLRTPRAQRRLRRAETASL